MRHTKKHTLKLFFARIRWYLKFTKEAIIHSKEVRDYKALQQLEKQAQDYLLAVERKDDKEIIAKAQGELNMITKILHG